MIRDAFELAKERCKDRGGAIIFIDEIDAIGEWALLEQCGLSYQPDACTITTASNPAKSWSS